jgi:hypothetical protein
MSKLETLFASPIYIQDNFHVDKLDYIENVCKLKIDQYDLKEYDEDKFNTGIKYVTHKLPELNIHNIPEFDFLTNDVLEHGKDFLRQYGYEGYIVDSLRVANSWFNLTSPGDMMQYHVHRGTMLNALVYVKADETDYIRLMKNLYDSKDVPQNPNTFSKTYQDIKAKPGRLVIFLGDQAHGTERQQSEERLVMVYNLAPKRG